MVDSESLGTLQPVAYHTVNRRYSEFLHLQTRLEVKPDLRKMIKSKKSKSFVCFYVFWLERDCGERYERVLKEQ